jgi:hypothetical protein
MFHFVVVMNLVPSLHHPIQVGVSPVELPSLILHDMIIINIVACISD